MRSRFWNLVTLTTVAILVGSFVVGCSEPVVESPTAGKTSGIGSNPAGAPKTGEGTEAGK